MVVSLLAFAIAQSPVTISASSALVKTVGRFDRRDPESIACAWSGSTVELTVEGTTVNVTLDQTGDNYWQVEIDGQPTKVITPVKGKHTIEIGVGPKQRHVVRLIKRTEAFVGVTKFLSFSVPGGKFVKSKTSDRRIEVIGDSITCGYGNEGKTEKEPFRTDTENAYQTYGAIAARAVGADVALVSWSGRKMWPDNTIPEIYDLTLPQDPTSKYAYDQPSPQAIVINLATNDFGKGNPDEAKWTAAYTGFIRRLRKHYPDAVIYCAIGSMMSDGWPPEQKALSTLRGYLTRMTSAIRSAGDRKVGVVEFAPQDAKDGIGSDWHPNITTHRKMAAVLVAALKRDLHW